MEACVIIESLLAIKFCGSWSTKMHKTSGSYPGQSHMTFLLMIDLNPTSPASKQHSILSVKRLRQTNASQYQLLISHCTGRQKLYFKTKLLVAHLNLLYCNFFIGSIGYLMSGSGLMNLFETVYASTAVSHMLSGKVIARAVRCHFLVDTALTALILSNIYGIPVPKTKVCSEECADESYSQTYDTSKVQIHDTCHSEEVSQATDLLDSFLKEEVYLADINQ